MPKLKYPIPKKVDPSINRRDLKILLRRLGDRLGYACPEDWYELTTENLESVEGLLAVVRNPIHAGRIVHPELNPLLFEHRKRSAECQSPESVSQ